MNWLQSFFATPVFTYAIIGLSVLAGLQYAIHAEWSYAGYWLSAAALNSFVTFGMK